MTGQRLLTPADAQRRRVFRVRMGLCVLSGVLLGFSFPPSQLGALACVGLIPLLIVLADIERYGEALRYTYLAMLVFHVITLNWTGGYAHMNDAYMMIAGFATMTVHPLFYLLPMGAYLLVRNHFGNRAALVALPVLWVGYEYTHSLSEWSFPWLSLGTTQSYNLAAIQITSVTGVYGLSLWILMLNVAGVVLYSRLAHGRWRSHSGRAITVATLIVVAYFIPSMYGLLVLREAPPVAEPVRGDKTIRVGIVQANIDPWEKWKLSGYDAIDRYTHMTDSLLALELQSGDGMGRPDIVMWPETAIPYYLLVQENETPRRYLREYVNRTGVSILTGLPHAVYYEDPSDARPSAKKHKMTGQRYDAFNAAALIQPGVEEIQWYGKMKFVPLAERVPYADAFSFLNFLEWDVGIGGWQIGRDSVIFVERNTGARFTALICYESTYPEFVSWFVRNGAEFIAVITIDSWWGRASGAFQHHRFSVLRAVENRRWLARCAVGGISCFIDPYGREYHSTELFTTAVLSATIERRSELTFYTRHGDWLGQGALFGAGMFVAACFGMKFLKRNRRLQWNNS